MHANLYLLIFIGLLVLLDVNVRHVRSKNNFMLKNGRSVKFLLITDYGIEICFLFENGKYVSVLYCY